MCSETQMLSALDYSVNAVLAMCTEFHNCMIFLIE